MEVTKLDDRCEQLSANLAEGHKGYSGSIVLAEECRPDRAGGSLPLITPSPWSVEGFGAQSLVSLPQVIGSIGYDCSAPDQEGGELIAVSRTPRRPWSRRVVSTAMVISFAVGVSVVVVVAAEGGFRLYRHGSLSIESPRFVEDASLLYALNPDHPDTPGGVRGGGPDSSAQWNVVCMGGSTTYGHEVGNRQTWPVVVESLTRIEGIDVRFVNAGVPGYGSRQLLQRYRGEIRHWRPSFVVVYSGWNRTGALVDPDGWVPGVVMAKHDSWLGKGLFSLGRRSLLFRGLYSVSLRTRDTRVWKPDMYHQIFEDDLRELVSEILNDRVVPVMVIYPSLFHSDMTPEDIEIYREIIWWSEYDHGMMEEIEMKHRTIRQIAAQHKIPIIDVQDGLSSITGAERVAYFMDAGHPTVEGNEFVGRTIAGALRPLLDPQRSGP